MPPLHSPVLIAFDDDLIQASDPKHRAMIRDHFGSNVDHFYGVKMPVIRELLQSAIENEEISKTRRWKLCDELTRTGVFEHKIAAFHMAWLSRRDWRGDELPRFSRWLHRSVDDWMDTDDLCIRVIGEFFLRFPAEAESVRAWSRLPGLWSRRGAAVSLIHSARRGQQWPLVESVAEHLKSDPEPLVAKACGWLLKVASAKEPDAVRAFVEKSADSMSPIVRRIALEKLR